MYCDAGYQGIAKCPWMVGAKLEHRVSMLPGKRRGLLATREGNLQDHLETAKAHNRSKIEHLFRVIKPQLGFQKTRLRGMGKNRWNIQLLTALIKICISLVLINWLKHEYRHGEPCWHE